jgi:hypothetical protein
MVVPSGSTVTAQRSPFPQQVLNVARFSAFRSMLNALTKISDDPNKQAAIIE